MKRGSVGIPALPTYEATAFRSKNLVPKFFQKLNPRVSFLLHSCVLPSLKGLANEVEPADHLSGGEEGRVDGLVARVIEGGAERGCVVGRRARAQEVAVRVVDALVEHRNKPNEPALEIVRTALLALRAVEAVEPKSAKPQRGKPGRRARVPK